MIDKEKGPPGKSVDTNKNQSINYTGERLVLGSPELETLVQEHIIRYMFAAKFIKSKAVLDAGCGTGYGSHLLSGRGAKEVIGIDASKEAIENCNSNYKEKNLKYIVDNCEKLHFQNSYFDVVTCFEVIEHLQKPESFLSEVRRILKSDGLFILSTPNKLTYPTGNPFHVYEYTEDEFKTLLSKEFRYVSIFYQTYPPTLAIYKPGKDSTIKEFDMDKPGVDDEEMSRSALYFVAICSNKEIQDPTGTIFLFDKKTLLLENNLSLQKWVKTLQKELEDIKNSNNLLQKEFLERTEWAHQLDKTVIERDESIRKLQKELESVTNWAHQLDKTVIERDESIRKLQENANKITEKDSQIENLQGIVSTKDSQIENLQGIVSTKDSQIENLQGIVSTKDSQIENLQGIVSTKDSQIENLQGIVSTKDSQIENLQGIVSTKDSQIENMQNSLYNLEIEMIQIKNSIIFKIMSNTTKNLDKMFPPGTSRGNFLRLARLSLLVVRNEGFKIFLSCAKDYLKKQLIIQKIKYSLGVRKTPKPVIDARIRKSKSEIIYNTGKRNVDHGLRNNMKIGSANILDLPRYPKVSLIIATYNQVGFLHKAIKSIETKTTYKNYEIILITDNLDENSEMRKYLKTLPYAHYVYTEKYCWGAMNNYAVTKSSGEFIIILNDDIEIASSNWIEALLRLALDEGVGVVGPKLLFPNGTLQEAGCIIWQNGTGWNYGRNGNPNSPDYNFVREVDFCTACCLMIKRKVFDEMNGFDPRYEVGYYEDTDLCFSIAKAGYKILYQPLAQIIHYEGRTQGTDVSTGNKSYQLKNGKVFADRWRDVLKTRYQDSIQNSFIERSRKSGINILYVDHYVPEYDKDSGSIDAFYNMCILSYLGHNVTLWPDNLGKTEPYTTELQQKGIEVLYGSYNFESFIKERGWLYHVCFLTRPHISIKHIDLIKKYAPQCKIVYDTVDVQHIYKAREGELKKKSEILLQADQMKQIEYELFSKSDIIVVKSEVDAEVLRDINPSLNIAIIPPFRIPKDDVLPYEKRKDLLFIGGFQHPPNVDAVEYLVNDIFPKIRKELSDVKLYVIGSNPPDVVVKLCSKSEGVEFLGYVKDVDPFLNKIKILVAPLRYGAGVKGKITQSLSSGLPVVTTSIGSEGISNDDGDFMYIADVSKDFVQKTIKLYRSNDLWCQFSVKGKKYAETHLSPELVRDTLQEIISTCTN